MKTERAKHGPAPVPERQAKQVGDWINQPKKGHDWSWVESSVWTERMLGALVNGVKGGIWFSLMDKVYRRKNLYSAFTKVKANRGSAGVDHVSIEMFERRLPEEIEKLHEGLRTGSYHPQAIRRTYIEKLGTPEKRPLGIPTVRDRVVQTALRNVLEPIFEEGFAEHSYGFRPGRGCKDALRRVNMLLKQGYRWIVNADVKSCFDKIPHAPLMARMESKIADSKLLSLINSYLKQEIKEGSKSFVPTEGTPQGSVITPQTTLHTFLGSSRRRALRSTRRWADRRGFPRSTWW